MRRTKPEEIELVSTGKAARLAGVTTKTVVCWLKSGLVSGYTMPSGHHRIELQSLAAFLSKRKVQA